MRGVSVILCLIAFVAIVYSATPSNNRYSSAPGAPRSSHSNNFQFDPSNYTIPSNFTSWNITFTPQVHFLLHQYYDGIPHSYLVPDEYWRSEHYLPAYLHPRPMWNTSSILDRTLTKYGLNLYDGATWEIGLALMGEFEVQETYEYSVLYPGSTGCDNTVGGLCDIRSDTPSFLYGSSQQPGSSLPTVPQPGNPNNTVSTAFFFRMISAYYVTLDPLIGQYANSFVYPVPCASCDSWNTFGVIVWDDWKPITGENVWGAIIGPLQTLYIQTNATLPTWTSYATAPTQVQLAVSIIPSLVALQSPEGSLYHCPAGSDIIPPDPNEATNVSNENDISSLAAISMLLSVLQNNTENWQSSDLATYINDLSNLQSGLKSWFLKWALAPPVNATGNRVFYQGGHVPFSGGFNPVPIDAYGGFAVDCQTWVSAVLGADVIDNKIANQIGTAYNIWQQTKNFSAHYADDGSIAGVGYTVHPKHEIWSAEWSWGAVLMTRVLSIQYSAMGCSQCAQWAEDLNNDSLSMTKNLQQKVADGGMISDSGGYLYCNHRYKIPWGWYANAIPSICATAWSIMNDHQFNPFFLGGGVLPTVTGEPFSYTGSIYGSW